MGFELTDSLTAALRQLQPEVVERLSTGAPRHCKLQSAMSRRFMMITTDAIQIGKSCPWWAAAARLGRNPQPTLDFHKHTEPPERMVRRALCSANALTSLPTTLAGTASCSRLQFILR